MPARLRRGSPRGSRTAAQCPHIALPVPVDQCCPSARVTGFAPSILGQRAGPRDAAQVNRPPCKRSKFRAFHRPARGRLTTTRLRSRYQALSVRTHSVNHTTPSLQKSFESPGKMCRRQVPVMNRFELCLYRYSCASVAFISSFNTKGKLRKREYATQVEGRDCRESINPIVPVVEGVTSSPVCHDIVRLVDAIHLGSLRHVPVPHSSLARRPCLLASLHIPAAMFAPCRV